MKFGWPISLILHAAFAVGGWISFSAQTEPAEQSVVVPVELLTVDELTNIRAAVKAETPRPSETPMQLETPMENAPDEGKTSEERVAEIPEDVPTELVTETPDETAETVPDIPEDTPKTPDFNLDDLSALIDKTRETQQQADQQKTAEADTDIYDFQSTSREAVGEGTALTMSELAALQSAMYKCWRIPLDATNPEELAVRVRVQLLPDGQVADVKLMDEAMVNRSSNPYMKVAAQRAVAAVSKCAPYDFLPEDKYQFWKDMALNFKPEV